MTNETLKAHGSPIVLTVSWWTRYKCEVRGHVIICGDEATIERVEIAKIVTDQERAASALCHWLAPWPTHSDQ